MSNNPKLVAALMRHGEYHQPERVPSALLPHPLTEAGIASARRAAVELCSACEAEGLTLDPEIACSRALRAWQTASEVAAVASQRLAAVVVVKEHDDLAERSVGAAANLTQDEIVEVVHRDPRYSNLPEDWKRAPDFRLPLMGAESLLESGERVARRLEQEMAELATRAVRPTLKLFVGHGGSFRFAAVRFGLLEANEAIGLSMFHCGSIWLEYGGPGRWRHIAGRWKVRKAQVADQGGTAR